MIYRLPESFLAWFISGFLISGILFIILGSSLGFKEFDIRIVLIGGVIVGSIFRIVYAHFFPSMDSLKTLSDSKIKEIDNYFENLYAQNRRESSRKFPIKDLDKDSVEFDQQFNNNLSYFDELDSISKKQTIDKFNLSESDWRSYLYYRMKKTK